MDLIDNVSAIKIMQKKKIKICEKKITLLYMICEIFLMYSHFLNLYSHLNFTLSTLKINKQNKSKTNIPQHFMLINI